MKKKNRLRRLNKISTHNHHSNNAFESIKTVDLSYLLTVVAGDAITQLVYDKKVGNAIDKKYFMATISS